MAGSARREGTIDQDELLSWVDVFLDVIEEHTPQEFYKLSIMFMDYLIQVELEHHGDQTAGGC